jgi:hypothetical protein
MYTYIAFLRGINVGGNKIVKMALLKALLETLNCSKVATYIQSGNAVFQHSSNDIAALTQQLSISTCRMSTTALATSAKPCVALRLKHKVKKSYHAGTFFVPNSAQKGRQT